MPGTTVFRRRSDLVRCGFPIYTLGSNGIDIKVSIHHTVSVSNFQSIEASTDDGMVHFFTLFLDTIGVTDFST